VLEGDVLFRYYCVFIWLYIVVLCGLFLILQYLFRSDAKVTLYNSLCDYVFCRLNNKMAKFTQRFIYSAVGCFEYFRIALNIFILQIAIH